MKPRALLALFLISAPGAAFAQKQGLPEVLERVGIDQRLGEQVPIDLELRDESGQAVKLGQYFGDRPVILTLVYYECPMLCSLVLNGLVRALNVLELDAGRDFEIVTVSIDPKETPELANKKKASYVGKYRRPTTAAGWHFLTGDAPAIEALTKAAGFRYELDPSTGQYAHGSGIMVLTPDGVLSRYFYGVDYSPTHLRLGLVEASARKIGTLTDAVMLFCFQYDPTTGRYSVAILNVIRAGAVLTVTALLGFMIWSLLRERRGARPLADLRK